MQNQKKKKTKKEEEVRVFPIFKWTGLDHLYKIYLDGRKNTNSYPWDAVLMQWPRIFMIKIKTPLGERIKNEERRGWRKERLVNLTLEALYFYFLFFLHIGFKIRDTTFHIGVNAHQSNKDSVSYLYCVIVQVFATAIMYPFKTTRKVSLLVHDLY